MSYHDNRTVWFGGMAFKQEDEPFAGLIIAVIIGLPIALGVWYIMFGIVLWLGLTTL